MFFAIFLFYQVAIRPVLTYGTIIYSLFTLFYISFKRLNTVYNLESRNEIINSEQITFERNAISENSDNIQTKDNSNESQTLSLEEAQKNTTPLLYGYIAIFCLVAINDQLSLGNWFPFWYEIFAYSLYWIVCNIDHLQKHHEKFSFLFEKVETLFETHVKPIVKYVMSKTSIIILRSSLYVIDKSIEMDCLEPESAVKIRSLLEKTSMLCLKSSKANKDQRSRKSMHLFR